MSGSAVKSHGWPKEGRQFVCKTDNFVPLFVPGLSTNSGSVSSSTSTPQDSSRKEVEIASGNSWQSASSSIYQFWKQFVVNIGFAGFVNNSSCRRKWRTCSRRLVQITLKNPKQKFKRGMTGEIRTTVCEIFLSGWRSSQTEVHAPAHISQDSDSERPTKVVSK